MLWDTADINNCTTNAWASVCFKLSLSNSKINRRKFRRVFFLSAKDLVPNSPEEEPKTISQ